MSEDKSPLDSAAASLFFEGENSVKQDRYDSRIAKEICKRLGYSAFETRFLEQAASSGDAYGFTPEWVSDYLHCPIFFSAVRDFWLEKANSTFFPDPTRLLKRKGRKNVSRKSTRAKTWSQVWEELWGSMKCHSNEKRLAVCFRPKWAEQTLVLHNYNMVLQCTGLNGWLMYYKWNDGATILQYLPDLITALRDNWEVPLLQ